MTLDRHAAERRRFARLLGVDGQLGSGLPIGDGSGRSTVTSGRDRDREPTRERTAVDDVHDAERARTDESESESLSESTAPLEPDREAARDSTIENRS